MSLEGTYAAKDVVLTIAGVVVDGGSDSDFVSIEMTEDMYTITVGLNGQAVRSRSNNRSSRWTVTVMQTSIANQVLQAAYLADEASGRGVFPISLYDPSCGETIFGAEAWIVRAPTKSFGKEAGSREWLIDVANTISLPIGATSYLEFG